MVAAVPAHHAVLASLPHQARAIVRVTGEDASRFLQGLLTADVGDLTLGTATPAALLTVKGKIITELWVLAVADHDGQVEPWLVLPASVADEVIAKLDGHIIMDDVELERLDEHGCALVWRDAPEPPPSPADLRARPGIMAFTATAEHPLPGLILVGPADALAGLDGDDLGEAADLTSFTAARIAAGRPAWGHEIVEDRFPPEVGFVAAVSYDKGCYLGQEPLSRIHNRGQVNRVMVRVSLAASPEALAEAGPLELLAGEAEAGQLTSWSERAGLAVVKRRHAVAGTTLHAGALAVEVTSGPLGDDPGRADRAASATVKLR
jgi:tRNA-modifying protein YgfZ